MSGPKTARGPEAFRERYRGIYGERWDILEAALAAPSDPVALDCGGASPYYLDSASVFAASCLRLPEGGGSGEAWVLDACAAPGGKSLVLASRMSSLPGLRLQANELSADRRRRLAAALDAGLPPGLRARVRTSGLDAAAMCRRFPEAFAAILLDAPCSSERHILADASALASWSPARTRNLAVRQWALLSSAWLMLAPGGSLVYSTCSLSPEENEAVAGRLEAKYGSGLEWDRPGPGDAPFPAGAEERGPGLLVLPDRCAGAGPMYVCRARKRG